jgi:hypothetical protein
MKTIGGRGKGGGAVPEPPGDGALRDGARDWAPGVQDDALAALVGRVLAAMPQAEALIVALLAPRLGVAAARLALDDTGDPRARRDLLRAVAGGRRTAPLSDESLSDFGASREACRLYGRGLWYTHRSGRVFIAPPATGGGHLAARAVRPADVEAALARLANLIDRLAATPLPSAPSAGPKASAPVRTLEAGRRKRPAPIRERGARRPLAPMRPPAPSDRDANPEASATPEPPLEPE